MSHTVPDIIDEQRVLELLCNQGEIIERCQSDEAAQIHVNAADMAGDLVDYLESVHARAQAVGMAGADHLALLADYARQLNAHHLDYLDRLNPV